MVPKDGSSVEGVLFDVPNSAYERRYINGYEGDAYKRIKVTVKVDGQSVRAWVYVGLSPEDYDAKMAKQQAKWEAEAKRIVQKACEQRPVQ